MAVYPNSNRMKELLRVEKVYQMEKIRLTKGNVKLGNMATFSKLYGNDIFTRKNGEKIQGSCGNYCNGCKNACYVRKSYRYPSVIENHAKNTKAFRENIAAAFESIDAQLQNKRTPFEVVRINQSGEIESAVEFGRWLWLAERHPQTRFYLYTKNFDVLEKIVKLENKGLITVPKNFICLISIWHEYGQNEFKKWVHLSWIKAFAYMDGYDYQGDGLKIDTECMAYKDGKMNHAITCDKCKKCFAGNYKVIGCHDH